MGWLSRMLGRVFPRGEHAPSEVSSALVERFRARSTETAGGGGTPVVNGDDGVIIRIRIDSEEWSSDAGLDRLFGLADEIGESVAGAGVGHLDGEGAGRGDFEIFSYGPDADRLWEVVAPLLERHSFPDGSVAIRQYGRPGDPGSREETIDIAWAG